MSTNSTGATSSFSQSPTSSVSLTMSTVPATTSSTSAAPSTTSVVSDVSSSIASSVSSAILTPGSTTTVPAGTTIDTTSVVSASSIPASTQLITSIVTQTPSEPGQTSVPPVTVIVTSETTPTATTNSNSATSSTTSSTSGPATLQANGGSSSGSSGLPPAGRTAIAVVVPVVAVALIVLAALFFWRKRKQRKSAEEARRKEVEEYGYNPNNDPTLPAVTADGHSEMAEDHGSGYRGWGAGVANSNRKASTTLSGGHTHGQLSDAGSNPGGFSQSPTAFGGSDGQNSDQYHKYRDTMTSDDLAALGSAPAASSNPQSNMRRGPSNASSSYSAGHVSETSDPSIHHQRSPSEGPTSPQNYAAYNTAGPYGDGTYGGSDNMPVVRDVSARRNTRIEQGGGYQQGNSGISQNF
ncbi:hypothetical protein B9Z65_53 [Elsinoe australis]|uniref:Uncharacterized protein n=1 Tax=Elsinoe australis TaxID=40998 RepID=A0A2P7ZK98_9PEZI|nr:hypothetical protein B9Z65_53 [Elsinoe australis]